MASLAPGGRIDQKIVEQEIVRLKKNWSRLPIDLYQDEGIICKYFSSDQIKNFDVFERSQLGSVLEICRNSASLADAGRKLFSASRDKRKKTK
jgi:transcriptional regulatory protein RtcR